MRTTQSIENIHKKVILEKINHKFHNSTNSYSYDNETDTIYSFYEDIAKRIGDMWVVFGKTAKYGQYHCNTTSGHVSNLIRFLQKHNVEFVIFSVLHPETILNNCLEYTDLDQNEECPITLDKIKEGIKTPCNHKFDKNAFRQAITSDYKCPLCRQSVINPIIQNIIQDL